MHGKLQRLIPRILLLTSVILFVLGLIYPIFITRSSVFGITLTSKSVYLTDTIKYFAEEKEWLMASLILITTLVFPLIKYIDLINRALCLLRIPRRIQAILSQLDKWSMTEVFVVALILLTVKMNNNFMSMEIRSGVTFLALSIVLRMVAVYFLSFKELQANNK